MFQKDVPKIIQANNNFTNRTYQHLSKTDGNVFFSPISMHIVLAMVLQGANEETQQDIEQFIELDKATSQQYLEILKELTTIKNINLSLANKIYVKQTLKLKKPFNECIKNQFLSETESIDFTKSADAVKLINNWCSKMTKERIKGVVNASDFDENTALILLNAIYFKGDWKTKFGKDSTALKPFHITSKNTKASIEVDMMYLLSEFKYAEDKKLKSQIVQLDYKNTNYSMVVVLPNEKVNIAEVEKLLRKLNISSLTNNLSETMVKVQLPKFRVETSMDLKQVWSQLGLSSIFNESAKFTDLIDGNGPLSVSKAIQKAFIEVNEEGAEAAAVTKVEIRSRCIRISNEPEFLADRPFLYFIIANSFKNILFMGRMSNPKQ